MTAAGPYDRPHGGSGGLRYPLLERDAGALLEAV